MAIHGKDRHGHAAYPQSVFLIIHGTSLAADVRQMIQQHIAAGDRMDGDGFEMQTAHDILLLFKRLPGEQCLSYPGRVKRDPLAFPGVDLKGTVHGLQLDEIKRLCSVKATKMARQINGIPQFFKIGHGLVPQIDAARSDYPDLIELEAERIGLALRQQTHIANIQQGLQQHIGAGLGDGQVTHDGLQGGFIVRKIVEQLGNTPHKRITVSFRLRHDGFLRLLVVRSVLYGQLT